MKIYCDGAVSNNGKKGAIGGWAFAIIDEKTNIILQSDSGREIDTTNQRMEMIAIIKALEALKNHYSADFVIHTVYSDSAYCMNCVNNGWWKTWLNNGWKTSTKEPVKNKELWQQLIPSFEDSHIVFKKIKGHNGDEWNEYVDKLAVAAKGAANGAE